MKKTTESLIFAIPLTLAIGLLFLLSGDEFSFGPTGKATSTVINVIKADESTCDINFVPEKNLVAFYCFRNIISRDYFLGNLSENVSAIFSYTPNSVDSWQSYNPNLPSWVTQDLLYFEDIKGYWFIMKNNSNFTFNGSVSSTEIVDLKVGWNLIGFPKKTTTPLPLALNNINGDYNIIATFNQTENNGSGLWHSYGFDGDGTLTEINGQIGYWIYLTNPGEVNFTTW